MTEKQRPGEQNPELGLDASIARLRRYIESTADKYLFEKQQDVLLSIHDFLVQEGLKGRGHVVAPTGSGKTRMFGELIRALECRALILVPSRTLVDQTEAELMDIDKEGRMTIGKVYSHSKTSGNVVISTLTSFVTGSEGSEHTSELLDPSNFDIVILDEVHESLSEKRKRALSEVGVPIIGFTASDKYSKHKHVGQLLPTQIHVISLAEAVQHEMISPFSNIVANTGVDLSGVSITSTDEYHQGELQAAQDTHERNKLVVDLYVALFLGRKAMASCAGVEHAAHLAEKFREADIAAAVIHGQMQLAEQRYLLELLDVPIEDGGLAVICNDRILSRGFNNRAIEIALNVSQTLSTVREHQRSGRAFRTDPNNPNKHAIVADFIDDNSQKAPVLFADPDIANAGTMEVAEGTSTLWLPENPEVEGLTIITDPEEVHKLAVKYSEERNIIEIKAPEDMLMLGGLGRVIKASQSVIKKAYATVLAEDPVFVEAHSHEYDHPSRRNKKGMFYDQELIAKISEEVEKIKPPFPPESWKTQPRVAALYGLTPTGSAQRLREITRQKPEGRGKFSLSERGTNATWYFSPEVVKELVESYGHEFIGDEAPRDWLPEEECRKLLYDITSEEFDGLFGYWGGDYLRDNAFVQEESGKTKRFISRPLLYRFSRHMQPNKGEIPAWKLAEQVKLNEAELLEHINKAREESPQHFYSTRKAVDERGQYVPHIRESFIKIVLRHIADERWQERRAEIEKLFQPAGEPAPEPIPEAKTEAKPSAKPQLSEAEKAKRRVVSQLLRQMNRPQP